MKAVTWHGKRDVRVDTVPDPKIQEADRRDHRGHVDQYLRIRPAPLRDARGLHEPGRHPRPRADGHRPRSRQRRHQSRGRRPRGHSRFKSPAAVATCATSSCSPSARPRRCATREWALRCSATPSSMARCPAGKPSCCGCPRPSSPTSRCPTGPPDSRFVYLSDVLPTAWQAVAYADIPDGGSVTVLGLGPIGDMAARIAQHLGYRRHRRRPGARAAGPRRRPAAYAPSISPSIDDKLGDVIRDLTDGRGTDSVIDAVGMEAHGSPVAKIAQQVTGLLPDAIAKPMMQKAGVDRLDALYSAIDIVRRGGTISLIGVYGGMADPLPMLTLFDKQIQLRMGQANVKKWVDDIMPLLTDDDPLGVDTFATHTLPLDEAPHAYDIFQKKQDGAVKIILKP